MKETKKLSQIPDVTHSFHSLILILPPSPPTQSMSAVDARNQKG